MVVTQRAYAAGGARTRIWPVAASAGSRRKTAKAKSCCSAASRALANPGWCRRSRSRFEHEGARCIEFRCSPYHQNSALYPIIEHLQRLLQFAARRYACSQAGETPAGAAALSLPPSRYPAAVGRLALAAASRRYPPLTLSPQKQKEKTQEALSGVARGRSRAGRRCTVPGKICTGPIPPRWNCSRSFSIKCRRRGCWPC